MDSERSDRARNERLGNIKEELRTRLRPLCLTMPNEMFYEMIDSMASIQLKYELELPLAAH
jgi:hypothetical protein